VLLIVFNLKIGWARGGQRDGGIGGGAPILIDDRVEATLSPRSLVEPPDMPVISGMLKTATILNSTRVREALAARACPIAFLSAQSDPVGIETSMLNGQ